MNEETLNNMEEHIDELPDEVRDFIFGEELKAVKAEIASNVEQPEEKLGISNMIMFFLLGSKTIQELNDYIGTLSIPDEKKAVIGNIIQEKIIEELLLLVEVHEEMDGIPAETTPQVPGSNLSSLISRLKESSISTAVKRDYGLNKETVPVVASITPTASQNTPSRAIDPYHESIDNE